MTFVSLHISRLITQHGTRYIYLYSLKGDIFVIIFDYYMAYNNFKPFKHWNTFSCQNREHEYKNKKSDTVVKSIHSFISLKFLYTEQFFRNTMTYSILFTYTVLLLWLMLFVYSKTTVCHIELCNLDTTAFWAYSTKVDLFNLIAIILYTWKDPRWVVLGVLAMRVMQIIQK